MNNEDVFVRMFLNKHVQCLNAELQPDSMHISPDLKEDVRKLTQLMKQKEQVDSSFKSSLEKILWRSENYRYTTKYSATSKTNIKTIC